ncbi:MAG: 2,3-bisphosphoglycerate-independent phosphoglycerate mutase [Clostridia bacterium]|nr:2,3-bisphosphoglycerate-independent phosphoglycerate mutase [Clostridia bacterium]
MIKKPLVLCIMDGFAISDEEYGNATKVANTPNLDKLFATCPNTTIGASGLNVGLPDGQMGNSEVGHTNIGAGRVIYQELTRISKSINDGDFFDNKAFLAAIENCKKNGTALHLMGLLSDGGVHSHNTHLYALLKMAKDNGLNDVFVHCLMDGRDVPPKSGSAFVAELQSKINEIGVGKISTVIGRYYAMDRDNRFERLEKAYDAMVNGNGIYNEDAVSAIESSYTQIDADGKNITDEFIMPTICCKNGNIKENDSVIFFNFRPDRAREITRTLVDKDFNGFAHKFFNIFFVCMTQYDATMPNVTVAFKPQSLKNTLGEYLSSLGKTQLRIAETEKYAHVTFFFNGGVESVNKGEDRILVSSPKVSTYDLQPEMSAPEVTDKVVKAIKSNKYDVIILNFANCDMVGHTGIFKAALKAVETVDTCVGEVVDATLSMGGAIMITADHGNADKMYEPDGSPFTAHTTAPVPLIIAGLDCNLKDDGSLCDIAPTMLKILELPIPKDMTGKALI